jgi:hypothetical protein
MVGKKFHWKRFLTPSLETQVLDIKGKFSKNKEESTPLPELYIEEKETTQDTKKRKTVNEIHKEIKQLVEQNETQKARLVLETALNLGYKGKRLDKWKKELMRSERSLPGE